MLCCLRREPVPSNRRKRKKLHGEACTSARSVLRKFTAVPLETLAETRDPDAVLCYSCENKLTSIHDLEIKLKEARSTIERMAGCLQAAARRRHHCVTRDHMLARYIT